MSYYGYNIDPEELERAKRKEREKREREREREKAKSNEENEEDSIDDNISLLEDVNDENESSIENEEDDTEYIEVDCSQCTQDPSTCNKNCIENLNPEYLKTLIDEASEEENDDGNKKNLLEEARKKALCLEPSLLEKFKRDLSKEDFKFVRNEMIWYTGIFFSTYIVGIVLLSLSLKFDISVLLSLSLLILFSQTITNLYCRGKYWIHIRKSLKNKKNPVSYETIVKEIPKYRTNSLTIPKKKKPFILYGLIVFLSIVVLFI